MIFQFPASLAARNINGYFLTDSVETKKDSELIKEFDSYIEKHLVYRKDLSNADTNDLINSYVLYCSNSEKLSETSQRKKQLIDYAENVILPELRKREPLITEIWESEYNKEWYHLDECFETRQIHRC